jgi:transposase
MLSLGTNVTVSNIPGSVEEFMDRVTELGADDQGTRRYRRRTVEEKCQIVRETLVPGRSVAEVARAHEVNANQVFDWRRLCAVGRQYTGRLGSWA